MNTVPPSGKLHPRVLFFVGLYSLSAPLAIFGFAAHSETRTAPASTESGWALVTSPNTSAAEGNHLNSVACISTSQCWAVGYYISGGVNQTLIEHWDGSSWSIVTSPNSGTGDNVLNGVVCPSPSQCWAVGYHFNGSINQTLIEKWDGTSWSVVVGSPNHGMNQGNYLYGVACASASACWAVGHFDQGPQPKAQTLIEQWDGSSWNIVSSPNNTAPGPNMTLPNYLLGVACTSASECWTVGYYNNMMTTDQTLIERWDGTSWSILSSPNSGTQNNHLNGVTCASGSTCWAVGYYLNGSISQTLTEQWDGTSWTIATSPDSGTENNALTGVTCTPAFNCWAVGYYDNGGAAQTLIEQWIGSSVCPTCPIWQLVTSPNKNLTGNNILNAVICSSESQCWTVGYYNNGSADQTLVEEYSPTIPPLTAIGSRKIHAGATFDLDLLSISPAIECRSPGSTGTAGVDHKIVFTFVNDVTSCGVASMGSLSRGPNPNQCSVDLTGVANEQYLTVTLSNVLDSETNTGDVSVTMGVLLGDVNASRRVDAADVSLVRQQTLQPITTSNFRADINVSGRIDAADVSIVRQQTLTSLP